MELQAFLTALEQRIARYDLLCHPYYKAWTAGDLTREDLRGYAGDYYHHVAAFPDLSERAALATGRRRAAPGRAAQPVRRGDRRPRRTASCGWILPRAWAPIATQFDGASRCRKCARLIDEFRRVAREGSTAEALAAFYAYESQVPRVAKEKADGLAQRYGADAKTCGYFKLHQFADVEHADVWRDLAERGDRRRIPSKPRAALNAAESAAKSLWHVLDGMEARRTAMAA